MCGITGYLSGETVSSDALWATVNHMAETMALRGPDDNGAWVDSEAGVALGHRRLSVLDLTAEGRQPMMSASGRYVIVFNGEIYNFRDIRAELERDGEMFRGHSDTEVALAAIARWGVEPAVKRFNGMFAFGLWDREERVLYLARDRVGEKPLYYGWVAGTFLFGSELKALRAHPLFRGDIDRDVLPLYLRFGYIPAPYSIYKGVRKLPAASIAKISLRNAGTYPEPLPYWSARAVAEAGVSNQFTESSEEMVQRLDLLLRDAVKLRMEADVPLGAFLSGGVDSTTVVALMQSQSQRPVRTFTIGFHEKAYDEAGDARSVAQHLGTDHTELHVTASEAMAALPLLPVLYDEPFADASQIPTYLVSKLAGQHVTVSLSGDAGDELFGGYLRYSWGSEIWRKVGWMPPSVRSVAARAMLTLSPSEWDSLFAKIGPLLPDLMKQRGPGDKLHKLAGVISAPTADDMYLGLVSQWKDPQAVVIGAGSLPTLIADKDRHAMVPELAQRMMHLDLISYLPDDILTKVDRASMGVSLEARVPLLDPRVIEFAWRLPLSMKIRSGQGKWLLRQVLYKYVPEHMMNRPKMGFGIPIGAWLRGPLRDWGESLLSEQRLREDGFFNPAPIREKWMEHLAGKRNWQYPLWTVLMFQAWLDEIRKSSQHKQVSA